MPALQSGLEVVEFTVHMESFDLDTVFVDVNRCIRTSFHPIQKSSRTITSRGIV